MNDDAVFVGPEPGITICWACDDPILEGQGRNKGGWLVHALCPPPVPRATTEEGSDG
jgi:hypothetical protein